MAGAIARYKAYYAAYCLMESGEMSRAELDRLYPPVTCEVCGSSEHVFLDHDADRNVCGPCYRREHNVPEPETSSAQPSEPEQLSLF